MIEGETQAVSGVEQEFMAKSKRTPRRGTTIRLWVAIVLVVVAIGAGVVYAFDQYRTFRIAKVVRQAFAAGQYEGARDDLTQWLRDRPSSGEAQYYRAWDALRRNQPGKPSRLSIRPENWVTTRNAWIA